MEHLGQVGSALLQGLCPTLKCGPESSDLLAVSYGFAHFLQMHGGTLPYVWPGPLPHCFHFITHQFCNLMVCSLRY